MKEWFKIECNDDQLSTLLLSLDQVQLQVINFQLNIQRVNGTWLKIYVNYELFTQSQSEIPSV